MTTPQIIDTRGEVKVATFIRKDDDWSLWCSRFESHASLLDWAYIMDLAASSDVPIPVSVLGAEEQVVSKQLYFVLLNKTDGKVVAMVRNAGVGSGLEGWRVLKKEYEAVEGGPVSNMLRFMLSPRDRWLDNQQRGKDLIQSLTERYSFTTDCERVTADLVWTSLRSVLGWNTFLNLFEKSWHKGHRRAD